MPVVHLRVTGRVQGVGFRWFVREHAELLQLAGWVRNTDDGEVEVAASGAPESLEALMIRLAKGPSGARVSAVHRVDPESSVTYPVPFRIEP